jgi:hypothetical protein
VDGIAAFIGSEVLVAHHAEESRHPGSPDAWILESWLIGRRGTYQIDFPTADIKLLNARDGSVWGVSEGRYVVRFDGTAWAVRAPQEDQDGLIAAAIDEDDRIWGLWDAGLASFDGAGWTVHDADEVGKIIGAPACPTTVAVGVEGDAIVGLTCGGAPLLRFDGREWQRVPVPGALDRVQVEGLAAGSRGDLWLAARTQTNQSLLLAHRGVNGWTVHPWPPVAGSWDIINVSTMVVAPDGTLWASVSGDEHGGVLSFDGSNSRRYLEGREIRELAFTADGSAWAIGPDGVYVIDGR